MDDELIEYEPGDIIAESEDDFVVDGNDPEEIAKNLLPQLFGDGIGDTSVSLKAEYLSKRMCYFSVRESCRLVDIHEKTVRRWREADPQFRELDTSGLTKLREYLSANLLDIQFTRNFHLVLQKDFRILYMDATAPDEMTKADHDYLAKIRQFYTPQALASVKSILSGKDTGETFDFTKMVISRQRETQIDMVEFHRD